jgi:hypothetical protein
VPSVRRVSKVEEESAPVRLPVRWAVILVIAAVAAVPVTAEMGMPAGIAVFFSVAGAVHLMIA